MVVAYTGEVVDPAEYRSDYGARADRWGVLALPVLRRIAGDEGVQRLMELSGRGRSAVYEALGGAGRGQKAYLEAAAAYAAEQLRDAGIAPPAAAYPVLSCYLRWAGVEPTERRCEWCGRTISPNARADARLCSDACRQAARRAGPKGKAGSRLPGSGAARGA